MVYTGTVCTEAEIALMAGENVDATGNTEANRNDLVAQAESFLSIMVQENVVDNYAGYNADLKRILSEWAARYAGMQLILFNSSGFQTRIEAENLINTHIFRMEKIEAMLTQADRTGINFLKNG